MTFVGFDLRAHRWLATAAFVTVGCGGLLNTSPRFYNGFDPTNGAANGGVQGGPAVVSNGSPPPTGAAAAGTVTVPAGAPVAVQLDAVTQTLRAQGYSPSRATLRRRGETGALVSFPFMARAGTCYVAVAIGDDSISSLSLTVTGSQNQAVGYSQTEAHPSVAFCAYSGGMHFPRAFVAAGQGMVHYQLYEGPPNSNANLTGVWNGVQRAAPTTVDPATQQRIAALTQALQGQNYQQVVMPRATMLGRGEVTPITTALSAGNCYTFATFGGPGTTDTDLYVVDAEGRTIQRDERPDVDAVARDVCVQTAGQYVLRMSLSRGDGPVWITAYARSAQGTAQVANTAVAMGAGNTGGNDIDTLWRSQSTSLLSVGYEAQGEPLNRELTEGQSADENVALAAGQCYAIVGVGSSRVRDIDLAVSDPRGQPVDQDGTTDSKAIVRVCATVAGQYRVRTTLASGSGAYRLGLLRWTSGTSGAGLSGIAFVRNAELSRVLSSDGYQGDADFEIQRSRIRENANATSSVTLRPNGCYALVVVGGVGVNSLSLSVSADGRPVAEDQSRSAFPSVRFCTQSGGAHRVTIASQRGGGDLVFRVFRQQQQQQ
ncbi:MAG: hypothetical protein Q8Q09_18940 [Deltaproteobacteria bacterium]|nr:hypothetical protein [Deltaproteobacteria bacterium]